MADRQLGDASAAFNKVAGVWAAPRLFALVVASLCRVGLLPGSCKFLQKGLGMQVVVP